MYYRWRAYDWGVCPAICGRGVQRRTVHCVQRDQNDNKIIKADSECQGSGEKPTTERPCNTHACGQWTTTEWRPCTHSCGDGGSQNRTVTCVDYRGVELDPISCSQLKPPSVQPCNNGPCHYTWRNDSWSAVSNKRMLIYIALESAIIIVCGFIFVYFCYFSAVHLVVMVHRVGWSIAVINILRE